LLTELEALRAVNWLQGRGLEEKQCLNGRGDTMLSSNDDGFCSSYIRDGSCIRLSKSRCLPRFQHIIYRSKSPICSVNAQPISLSLSLPILFVSTAAVVLLLPNSAAIHSIPPTHLAGPPLSTELPRPGARIWCDLAQSMPKLYGSPNQIQRTSASDTALKWLAERSRAKRWPESELKMS